MQSPEGEAALSVIESVVFPGEMSPCENQRSFFEIQTPMVYRG
jgi:hypothetical protein